jgi:hypothetical protein
VSSTATLKDGIFISSHFFAGMATESVKTTLFLQAESRHNEDIIRMKE